LHPEKPKLCSDSDALNTAAFRTSLEDKSVPTPPPPFDANKEALHLYDISKDPNAFQKEMNSIKGNPANYKATLRAIEQQEQVRESMAQSSGLRSLHELKIVHDPKTGAVKDINTMEVPVQAIGHESQLNLPKVSLMHAGLGTDGATHPAKPGEAAKPGDAPDPAKQAAAQREAAQKQDAENQKKVDAEASNLLTKLQNHDGPGFAKEYDSLPNSALKAAVGRAMVQQELQSHDPTTRISQNPDGSIKSVEKNGKLEYITPGEFLNETYEGKDHKALQDYYKSLSPQDKQDFAKQLQAESQNHNVRVVVDPEGNLKEVDDASGKKIYPDGKFGGLLHKMPTGGVVLR
jgi:hypothetical protein